MTKRTIYSSLLLACGSFAVAESWFATQVVGFSNLGVGIYGNPNAALGAPTSWVVDTSANGGSQQRVSPSIGYPAWNVDDAGQPVVVTIRTGGYLILSFSTPIRDDPKNWYGMDFIVFGNATSSINTTWTSASNPENVFITSGPDWIEPMPVSVSPDGMQWYTYPVSASSGADGLWPTQAFRWNATEQQWGSASNPHKPVPPSLQRASLTGQSVAQAIAAYDGSAGGTAFDLRDSGFSYIRFIRIDGNGGEVDAVSRVRPATQTVSATRVP